MKYENEERKLIAVGSNRLAAVHRYAKKKKDYAELPQEYIAKAHSITIENAVRTLLADEEFCDKIASEYELAKFQNRKRGDGMDERFNIKKALRNAAGMKEEKQ